MKKLTLVLCILFLTSPGFAKKQDSPESLVKSELVPISEFQAMQITKAIDQVDDLTKYYGNWDAVMAVEMTENENKISGYLSNTPLTNVNFDKSIRSINIRPVANDWTPSNEGIDIFLTEKNVGELGKSMEKRVSLTPSGLEYWRLSYDTAYIKEEGFLGRIDVLGETLEYEFLNIQKWQNSELVKRKRFYSISRIMDDIVSMSCGLHVENHQRMICVLTEGKPYSSYSGEVKYGKILAVYGYQKRLNN